MLYYHGTTPNYAEEILEDGCIFSSNELEKRGKNYRGWNFEVGVDYGDGIFLAETLKKAEYFASLRLEYLWEEIDREGGLEKLIDIFDDINYIVVFKIVINDEKRIYKERGYNKLSEGEIIYLGNILSKIKSRRKKVYFDGVENIDKSGELENYINHRIKVIKETLDNQEKEELEVYLEEIGWI